MNQPGQNPLKRSKLAFFLRPKIAIPCMLLLCLILTPILMRGWHLRGIPVIEEPVDLSQLQSVKVADEDNAWIDLQHAASDYRNLPYDKFLWLTELNQVDWELIDDDVRNWLSDNAQTLQHLKNAARKRDGLPPESAELIRYLNDTENVAVPVSGDLRDFIRWGFLDLLHLKAEQVHQLESPQLAWKWYRICFQLSFLLQRNCSLDYVSEPHFLGRGSISRVISWSSDPRLTSEDLRIALNDLQEDFRLSPSLSEIYLWTYAAQKHSIQTYFNAPDEQTFLARLERYSHGYPETFLRLMAICHANRIAHAETPFRDLPKESGKFDLFTDSQNLIINSSGMSAREFDSLAERIEFDNSYDSGGKYLQSMDETTRSFYHCLMIALALQAYHRDHDRFPETLDELVPDYFDRVPFDFFDGKPLKYRLDPEGAVVYSVDENLVDDGGTYYSPYQPMLRNKKGRPPDRGFLVPRPSFRPLIAPRASSTN